MIISLIVGVTGSICNPSPRAARKASYGLTRPLRIQIIADYQRSAIEVPGQHGYRLIHQLVACRVYQCVVIVLGQLAQAHG